ncbi:MAG: hypothetical protein ACKOW8_03045, partial [Flavobacteriales bacterium]
EEFQCLEEITPRDFSPKLKPNYYREQSIEYCRVLLAAYLWRDQHAKTMNVPPHYIVSNELLENYLFSSLKYNDEFKGFHPRIISSEDAILGLMEIRSSYDSSKSEMHPRNRTNQILRFSRGEELARIEKLYNPVRDRLNEQYGEITGNYLLRNIKKHILKETSEIGKLRKYQEKILSEMLALA